MTNRVRAELTHVVKSRKMAPDGGAVKGSMTLILAKLRENPGEISMVKRCLLFELRAWTCTKRAQPIIELGQHLDGSVQLVCMKLKSVSAFAFWTAHQQMTE